MVRLFKTVLSLGGGIFGSDRGMIYFDQGMDRDGCGRYLGMIGRR